MRFEHLLSSIIAVAISYTTAFASDFPQTFEHLYGTTIIKDKPVKIISLGLNDSSNFLALDVKPIAIRDWAGDFYENAPWRVGAWGDFKPVVMAGEVDIEKIASLEPDLIVSIYSSISQQEYDLLSQIAPTISVKSKQSFFSTAWDERARIIGRAVGESEKTEALISSIEQQIDDIKKSHPDWQGKTTTVANFGSSYGGGAVRSPDPRARLLEQLGLKVPNEINDLGKQGTFWVEISPEDISPLDLDVLIWRANNQAEIEGIKTLALRKTLNAYKQGREILLQGDVYEALYNNSLSSLPYFLDHLVPQIELAIDGDPKTIVPSAKQAGLLD